MKSILIVEDNPQIQLSYKLVLEKNGYQVLTANDGHQAFEMLDSHAVAIVLLDILMPHMDGLKFLSELQSHKSKPPVLVLSNFDNPEIAEKSQLLGAREYIIKSNTGIEDLLRIVRHTIGEVA